MSGNRKKKRTIGDVISSLVIVIAIGVFCFAGFQLVKIYLNYKVGVDEYKGLARYADTAKETEGFNEDTMVENETMGEGEWGDAVLPGADDNYEEMENPIDFESLREINTDVTGWLEVEAIDTINYPIVQGEDNDFYLHRTFSKQDNFAGSIFLDCLNSRNFSNRNNILYGHNMKNGSMFGLLKKFREQETYDESPYFWIYTPNWIYKYEIFSCAEVATYSENYQISFSGAAAFQKYIQDAMRQSLIDTGVDVTLNDTVVTLSTCTGNDATRFIVQGKRVRTYKSVPKKGGYETEGEEQQ
ncbi:MAG: class B sortase [Eubacteriales bacterium]|nr:class B sortase [Eubacteriales bacterium]